MSTVSLEATGKSTSWPVLYVAVALTTMATLILELALTRIFSVVFYYHLAFLAISIALFGLGAGGVLSYLVPQRGVALYRRLGVFSALNAASVIFSLAYVLNRSGDPGFWAVAGVYFAASLPFLISGIVVALAIADTVERVDRVYFADLMGAAIGCLLLIPFLNLLGGPGTLLSAAVLFAAASAVWFGLARSTAGRAFGVALALAVVALIVYNQRSPLIDIKQAKGMPLGQEVFVQWNSFSRVALQKQADGGYLIAIDADATTGIPQFDLDHLDAKARSELSARGPGFAYQLRPGAKTLILGAGGGWDVARAIAAGSKDVTGVEINPIIANTIMRGRYKDLSGRLYFRPEVRIAVEDGRTYAQGTREKFQLLQATLVDTWASTAAGAFALSENNIYTTEAFVDYFTHLTDDGVLSFTRWGFEPPRESLRLVSLARAALERLGEKEAWRHVIVVREEAGRLRGWGATDTVLISRKPLTGSDLAQAKRVAADQKLDVIYLPDSQDGGAFGKLLRTQNLKAFYRSYPFDVEPVSDDRPFFFFTVQPWDVFDLRNLTGTESADFKVNMAVRTLIAVLGVSLAATLITLLLPPLLLRSSIPRQKGVAVALLYFLCLGAGYILIQVALIQKLVLFLGHPTYALTVVIFSMLISSGFGSFMSRRVAGTPKTLMAVLAAIAVLVGGLAFSLPPLLYGLAGIALPLRVLLSIGFIVPAGFLMGMPFPAGLASLNTWCAPAVRWAWSLNAAASVAGASFAILTAIYFGLTTTLLCGAALYLLALWTVRAQASGARP